MNIDKFVNAINQSFGDPFLPDDFVDAERRADGFRLRIGRRDVHFNNEGEVLGCGTDMRSDWEIAKGDLS